MQNCMAAHTSMLEVGIRARAQWPGEPSSACTRVSGWRVRERWSGRVCPFWEQPRMRMSRSDKKWELSKDLGTQGTQKNKGIADSSHTCKTVSVFAATAPKGHACSSSGETAAIACIHVGQMPALPSS